MVRKWHIIVVITIVFCGLSGCSKHMDNQPYAKYVESAVDGKSIVANLDSLFIQLSNNKNDSFSALNTAYLNEAIKTIMESIKDQNTLRYIAMYRNGKELNYCFTLSNDEKLAVFSWNTGMGKMEDNLKNIVLYAKENKVIPLKFEGPYVRYRNIFNLKPDKNGTVYLFQAYHSLEDEYICQMDGYSIKNRKLMPSYIFPNDRYSLITSCEMENIPFKSGTEFLFKGEDLPTMEVEVLDSKIASIPSVYRKED